MALLIVILSMFYLGFMGILLNRLHFLSILLCLELLLISLFIGIAIWNKNTGVPQNTTFNLLLLTLSACEASIGLSLMVALSRTHSSDLVASLSLLQY
uniref:NADH-ubiquinone oxidoreductase chain 4L n=2 Tax=Strongylocentrotus TaxID=7664 RepID=A8KR71_STRDR|nr:NADH dehydrogenase subunit 4L [Strongylocentrotus droebachiensis]YP_001527868.1 NADH dehydrogenase subunit 4L [Strongylocentrotus pallidus]CAP12674.1 NADH dehydrogenase subunit 4L [Strongylocentrotus droebachiensis]CAP12687.1 NADH dehydrogenase subunit 4L [Strongylocentrotus pallidus]